MQNLFYISNLKFKIKELFLEQFMLITRYKMRNKQNVSYKRELREWKSERKNLKRLSCYECFLYKEWEVFYRLYNVFYLVLIFKIINGS